MIVATIWGEQWKGKTIRALCDNLAIINQRQTGHATSVLSIHRHPLSIHCSLFTRSRSDALTHNNFRTSHPRQTSPYSNSEIGAWAAALGGRLKCYLSAVRHSHLAEGYPDPGISIMAHQEQVLKSIQTRAKNTKCPTKDPWPPTKNEELAKGLGKGHQ